MPEHAQCAHALVRAIEQGGGGRKKPVARFFGAGLEACPFGLSPFAHHRLFAGANGPLTERDDLGAPASFSSVDTFELLAAAIEQDDGTACGIEYLDCDAQEPGRVSVGLRPNLVPVDPCVRLAGARSEFPGIQQAHADLIKQGA